MGRMYRIEYEGLHFICFCCGRYGHKKENYPKDQERKSEEIGDLQNNQTSVNNGVHQKLEIGEEAFSPWMLAQKTRRGKKRGNTKPTYNRETNNSDRRMEVKDSRKDEDRLELGSRFNILMDMDDQMEMNDNVVDNQAEATRSKGRTEKSILTTGKKMKIR